MTSQNYTFPSSRYICKANLESLAEKIKWLTNKNIHPPPPTTITKYTDTEKKHSRLIRSGGWSQLKRTVRVNTKLWKHFVKKVMKIERRVLERKKIFSEHLRVAVEKFIIYNIPSSDNNKKQNNLTELDCKHYAKEKHSACPLSCHKYFFNSCFNPIMDILVSFPQRNSSIISP